MGIRFRRSIKLFPGVRLNVGKTGLTSVSVGVRGAHTTIGRKGTTQSFGLPGTGMSFVSRSSSRSGVRGGPPNKIVSAPDSERIVEMTSARFGLEPPVVSRRAGVARMLCLGIGVLLLIIGAVLPHGTTALVGMITAVVGLALPSHRAALTKAAESYNRLLGAELEQRAGVFRTLAEDAETSDAIQAAVALQSELDLTDDEAGAGTICRLHSRADFLAFKERLVLDGDRLSILTGHERVTAPDVCYFAGKAQYDKRGDDDPSGMVYLTDAQALFVAPSETASIPWAKAISVSRDGHNLLVQRKDRRTAHSFGFDALTDSLKAEFIALRLWNSAAR